MLIGDDSGLLLEVLEVHDGYLLVRGVGAPFVIRPSPAEAISVLFDQDDPVNLVRAAQAAGYDPRYAGDGG